MAERYRYHSGETRPPFLCDRAFSAKPLRPDDSTPDASECLIARVGANRYPRAAFAVTQLASDVVSERITADVVAKVSRLARLDLTPEEIEVATTQLSAVLAQGPVESIDEVRWCHSR